MKFWRHPIFWIAVLAIGLSIGIFENSTCEENPQCFKESYIALFAMAMCAIGFAMTIATLPEAWLEHDDT